MRLLLSTVLAVALTACGGGSAAPDSGPPDLQPDPACPAVWHVLAVGDSTMAGAGDMLQRALDARLGKGKAVVWNRGQNGATSADALAGYRGQTLAGLIAELKPDLVVANYGMGDMRDQLDVDGFVERLREMRSLAGDTLILQTPNPATPRQPFGSERAETEIAAYAAAVRQVAADTGTALADARAFVLALPDWQDMMADGIHPAPALHQAIVDGVTAPAVAAAMAHCAAAH